MYQPYSPSTGRGSILLLPVPQAAPRWRALRHVLSSRDIARIRQCYPTGNLDSHARLANTFEPVFGLLDKLAPALEKLDVYITHDGYWVGLERVYNVNLQLIPGGLPATRSGDSPCCVVAVHGTGELIPVLDLHISTVLPAYEYRFSLWNNTPDGPHWAAGQAIAPATLGPAWQAAVNMLQEICTAHGYRQLPAATAYAVVPFVHEPIYSDDDIDDDDDDTHDISGWHRCNVWQCLFQPW
jgi:hypothetical protein